MVVLKTLSPSFQSKPFATALNPSDAFSIKTRSSESSTPRYDETDFLTSFRRVYTIEPTHLSGFHSHSLI